MSLIDLRSDTVTRPSDRMREVMANAPVGDDVYAEDPTVNKLQEISADLLGFESALFVPSGTMGNQVAVWSHTESGEEVIVEAESHVFNYELGTMGAFSGVTPRPIPSSDGTLSVDKVKAAIHPDKYYLPTTGLITLENTHNNQGGRVYPLEKTKELLAFAVSKDLPVHLDGARIFNAAVASGKSPKELAEGFDSVMFCLSKGLGAPIGSVLVGSEEFISTALVGRKRFGGGMRQAGIIAAAGIYSLENNIERLDEDHQNAQTLARGLKELGFAVTPYPTETNIFFVNTEELNLNANKLAKYLKQEGIVISPSDDHNIRLVTHLDLNEEDIQTTLEKIRDFVANL